MIKIEWNEKLEDYFVYVTGDSGAIAIRPDSIETDSFGSRDFDLYLKGKFMGTIYPAEGDYDILLLAIGITTDDLDGDWDVKPEIFYAEDMTGEKYA